MSHILQSFPEPACDPKQLPFYRPKNIFMLDLKQTKFKNDNYEGIRQLSLIAKFRYHAYFINKEQFLDIIDTAARQQEEKNGLKQSDQVPEITQAESGIDKELNNDENVQGTQEELKVNEGTQGSQEGIQVDGGKENNEVVVGEKKDDDFVFDASQILPFFKLDYIVLSCPADFVSILKEMHPFMNPNCKLVLYERFYSKINDAYNYLKNQIDFIMVEVSDFMVRDYQVFTMRTHPIMRGPLNEGFFLTAYRVLND